MLLACLWLSGCATTKMDLEVMSPSMYPNYLVDNIYQFNKKTNETKIERFDVVGYKEETQKIFPNFTQSHFCDFVNMKEKCFKSEQTLVMKRVIGLPNDKIEIKSNRIFINNIPFKIRKENVSILVENEGFDYLEESGYSGGFNYYIEEFEGKKHSFALAKKYSNSTKTQNKIWILKENEYFVMGDNRVFSQDSRALGAISSSKIEWIRKERH